MRCVSQLFLVFLLGLILVPQARGAVVFDEASFGGDWSDDNTEPTDLGFFVPGAAGAVMANSVIGQTDSGAPDIFTFEIATGNVLQSLILASYEMGDAAMFVAIAEGDQFPNDYFEINDESFADTSSWLGGSTVGPSDVGTDVLARMGSIGLGSGYTPPLGAGTYTFYLQQTGPLTQYTLDFNVSSASAVPEPSTTLALTALAFAGVGYRRLRRKHPAKPFESLPSPPTCNP